MGRHRTPDEKRVLGEQARAMRAAGLSTQRIKAELGIGGSTAAALLRDGGPTGAARPRQPVDVRALAVELRRAGRSYGAIAAELGVSKSTCSLWLRDVVVEVPTGLPAPAGEAGADAADGPQVRARLLRARGHLLREIADELGVSVKTVHVWTTGLPVPHRARHGGDAAHVALMNERRWAAHRRHRDIESQQRKLAAANEVGLVDDRTLLLLGAVAYWCEGTKSKPWRPRSTMTFINSDPVLIRLFVRWLGLVGVPPERWVVRLQIHETADVPAAEQYWRGVLQLPDLVFARATLKRHVPLTRRKNVGADYHGCVTIYVRRGAELLEQVEGRMVGALLGAGGELPGPAPAAAPACEDGEGPGSAARQSAVG